MEEMKTYKITIYGDKINDFIRGRISGIITGVTNNIDTFREPLNGQFVTTGHWIFKHKRIISTVYTFDATEDQLKRIDELIKYSCGKDNKRLFSYGVKQVAC